MRLILELELCNVLEIVCASKPSKRMDERVCRLTTDVLESVFAVLNKRLDGPLERLLRGFDLVGTVVDARSILYKIQQKSSSITCTIV